VDFLSIEIVGAVLGEKQFILAIDPYIALSGDLVALRKGRSFALGNL
jgi:hypothetical protein